MLPDNQLRKVWRAFLTEYYRRKYCRNIVAAMKTKVQKGKGVPKLKPGIALSFDDSFRVEHWVKYGKELFGFYDVKVTFNINAFHHFESEREHSQKEIDLLLELQSNGHEIAHHGFKHKRAVEYVEEKGLNAWIKDEIESLFDWMSKQSHSITNERFKRPVTFAFPNFVYNTAIIQEIVPKYFKIVRGYHKDHNLTPYMHTGFAPSIDIDRNNLTHPKIIKKIMKLAKKGGKNIILTCHSLLPDEVDWDKYRWGTEAKEAGKWRISPETIQYIIKLARKMDMPFYTTSEIAGVATFIDPNFEECIRKQLNIPDDKWIMIDDLSHIKSLDLSGQGIFNLDGIQYFTHLEYLDISENDITDFRLLTKLPYLKHVNRSNNRKVTEVI